jgi:hypothetical protein
MVRVQHDVEAGVAGIADDLGDARQPGRADVAVGVLVPADGKTMVLVAAK